MQSLFLVLAVLAGGAKEWPAGVKQVTSAKGKTVSIQGLLEDGKRMETLRWASYSTMACWPSTQDQKFSGNHVLYATTLPGASVMKIKVTPKDPAQNLSLWAYSIGATDYRVPPTIESCVSCEADHKWDRPWKDRTQDHTRSVELRAIANPYNVLIGVSGPKEATKGEFTLEIILD